jgi:DNA-binding NarL/FixJ family response regulator
MRTLLLVVDDAATIGRLRLTLRHAAGIQVAAMLDGRASIRAELSRLAPDVILVDEMCQRMNTVARLREASTESPGATLLLMADRCDDISLLDAYGAGAHAVLSRHMPAFTLGALIGEIAQGRLIIGPGRAGSVAPRSSGADDTRPFATPRVSHLRVVADQDARGTRTTA